MYGEYRVIPGLDAACDGAITERGEWAGPLVHLLHGDLDARGAGGWYPYTRWKTAGEGATQVAFDMALALVARASR